MQAKCEEKCNKEKYVLDSGRFKSKHIYICLEEIPVPGIVDILFTGKIPGNPHEKIRQDTRKDPIDVGYLCVENI